MPGGIVVKADPGLLGEDVMVKSEPVDLQEFYASQLQVVLVIVFDRFDRFYKKINKLPRF